MHSKENVVGVVLLIVVGPPKVATRAKTDSVRVTCAEAHRCFSAKEDEEYKKFCGGAPHWGSSKFATARTLYMTVASNLTRNGTSFNDFVAENSIFANTHFSDSKVYKFAEARAPAKAGKRSN